MTIKVDQGGRAPFIGVQPDANGLRSIILALKEGPVAEIAPVRQLGRPFCDVVDGFALRTSAPPAEALHDFVGGQVVIDDCSEGQRLIQHELLQGFSLADRAGKTIQDETAATVQAHFALANHLQHSCVWDQLSPADVLQGFPDGWGLGALRATPSAAEDISGGKVTRAEALMEESGLSSLTDARGSQQYESFGRMLQFWQRLTSGWRALHPCWTIGIHRGSHAHNLRTTPDALP